MTTFYRGADLDVSLTITDEATSLPIDLTGATAKFRLGQTTGRNASYDQAMTLGAGGTATHTVPAATTLNFNGQYTYTVHVTEASGRVFIAAQGTITFTNIILASA